MYVWMEVTNDEKELPVRIADTAEELAKMIGITKNGVRIREEKTREKKNRINGIIKVEI